MSESSTVCHERGPHELASQAVLWYNRRVNDVLSGRYCKYPLAWTHLLRRCIMDTIPPHANSDNAPLKRCPACPEGQQWHPATPEFFSRQKDKKI
jgi:hypothetical protein